MQRLRQQVDRIDLKMLHLLQQRTKLSVQIGRMKHRHGAVVYVPERERELIARLTGLTKGQPPAQAVAAIYREIFSSSRAAQGQAPIGLLQASISRVLPVGRWCFGACDRFSPKKTWAELAKGLDSGALSLVLLTGADLLAALRTSRQRKAFLDRLAVVGDFPPASDSKAALDRRIFIVTPRGTGPVPKADRVLILIECKSTQNAIKSLLRAMPDFTLTAEELAHSAQKGQGVVRLSLAQPAKTLELTGHLLAAGKSTGISLSILGIYPGIEDYGG
jgi:chorismate mutase